MKRSRPSDPAFQTEWYPIMKDPLSGGSSCGKFDGLSRKQSENKGSDNQESLDGIIDTAIATDENRAEHGTRNKDCHFIPCLTPLHIPKDPYVSNYIDRDIFSRDKHRLARTQTSTCDSPVQFSSSAVLRQSSQLLRGRDSFAKVEAEIDEILSPVSDCAPRANSSSVQGLQSISKLLSIPVCEPMNDEKRIEPCVAGAPMTHGKGQAMQEILRAMATPPIRSTSTNRRGISPSSTQCHLCGKTYTESSNLSKHIRTVHLKLRPFQCNRCSSSFAERNKLRKHIQSVHERARPYKCELCSATFSQASDRKRHRLVLHEGCRPFSCEQCGKAFGRRSSLTQHSHRVHKRIKT